MSFLELAAGRESIREYDPSRKVEDSVLHRILETGRLAPSAANRQPWQFWVISTPELLAKVHRAYSKDWFAKAPQILVVVGDRSQAWRRQSDGYSAIETDLTIAMDHLILAAEAEGVGTCWIAAFEPQILNEALSLAPNQVVFAMTPLGYPPVGFKKKGNKQRKNAAEVFKFL